MSRPGRSAWFFAVIALMIVGIIAVALMRLGGKTDPTAGGDAGVSNVAVNIATTITERTSRAVEDMIDATSRAAEPLVARFRDEKPATPAPAEPPAAAAASARRARPPRAVSVRESVAADTAPPENAAAPEPALSAADGTPAPEKGPAVGAPGAIANSTGSPEASAPAPADNTVYSTDDADVQPPQALKRIFATDTPSGLDPESLSLVSLVINELGQVESVRLVRDAGRFQDRMMLSIIKAWRFEPAKRDGRPVKYQLTMLLVP